MQRISRTLVASLIVATTALAGCGGGGGGDDGGGSGSGGGLVGVWKADIGGIISENPLLIAATGEGTCSGPVVLNLNADGTFSQSLDGRCTFPGGGSGAMSVNASGNYSVSGSQITVTNAVNSGVYAAGGVTQSFSLIANGVAEFTLNGNTLVLKPAVERGTQQTYSRGS
jgi:hypothetical protein